MREGLLTTRNSKSERVIKQYGYLSLMSESRVDLQAAKCQIILFSHPATFFMLAFFLYVLPHVYNMIAPAVYPHMQGTQ